jgi:acetylornithine/succinyldiaminopimelate/putrescine aminotransferase/predicted amino acid dehydrogenase
MLDAFHATKKFLKQIPWDWNQLKHFTEDYTVYARPLTGRLLQAFHLDWHYEDGQGNWLIARHQYLSPRKTKVFDAVGGYGANLLGHKNALLQAYLIKEVPKANPSHTQGSIRSSSGQLAEKISHLLLEETKQGPWITHFSNSGTEAVEAAIKHALLSHHQTMQELSFQIQEHYYLGLRFYQHLDNPQKKIFFKKLRSKIDLLKKKKSVTFSSSAVGFHEYWEELHRYHKDVLREDPYLVSMEGGFHGKTLGSLKVTTKKEYGESFYVNEDYQLKRMILSRHHIKESLSSLESLQRTLLFVNCSEHHHQTDFEVMTSHFIPVACVIVEPLQGEAGIIEIPKETLQTIRSWCTQKKILLLFDEVQSGLYRTGFLACGTHAQVVADIYCFSKALGGGLMKIGATSILKKKYIPEFGLLHTSTFAEDDLSSKIALKVLDILTGKKSPVKEGIKQGQFLREQLEALQKRYPHLIKDIRGKGLMLAIEFHQDLRQRCFEFKFFSDANMMGHLLASALLYHHRIRLAPTLSGPFTLRIEPSIYLSEKEAIFFLKGLEQTVAALDQIDMPYFFKHLYRKEPIEKVYGKIAPQTFAPRNKRIPLAIFLNHPIDHFELTETMPSHKNVSPRSLLKKIHLGRQVFSFDLTHREYIYDQRGRKIELALMSLPLPSEEIMHLYRSPQRSLLVEKIQDGIFKAKNLGAQSIGLGQFTSIVTHNGLYLNSLNTTLTTGNAYTCALSCEAIMREIQKQSLSPDKLHLCCIGAAGNILSVSASILTDWCNEITLIYHSSLEKSAKLRLTVQRLFSDILQSQPTGPCSYNLKQLLVKNPLAITHDDSLLRFCAHPDVRRLFRVETNLDNVSKAHIVLTGTNAPGIGLQSHHFKEKAILVDFAVPRNIPESLLQERPDLTFFMGGIAGLPKHKNNQGISAHFFPLPQGQVFACMAETMILSFLKKDHYLALGSLSRKQVEQTQRWASELGFHLAELKQKASY